MTNRDSPYVIWLPPPLLEAVPALMGRSPYRHVVERVPISDSVEIRVLAGETVGDGGTRPIPPIEDLGAPLFEATRLLYLFAFGLPEQSSVNPSHS